MLVDDPRVLFRTPGCGNGRYLGSNPAIAAVGCDLSKELVRICRLRHHFEVCEADALAVPFRSHVYDAGTASLIEQCALAAVISMPFSCCILVSSASGSVISIAVLHHISTRERRLKLLSELARIVKPGGTVLICAWALEQEAGSKRVFDTADVFVPWHVPLRYMSPDAGAERSSTAAGSTVEVTAPDEKAPVVALPSVSTANGVVDSQRQTVVFQRYCHMFRQGELESLLKELPVYMQAHGTVSNRSIGGADAAKALTIDIQIEESYYDKDNWCVRFRVMKL